MFEISHKDHNCILNIIDAIEKIQKYSCLFTNADEFNSNNMSFDATLMNFIVIGEMTSKISEDLIHRTDINIDWFKIKGFRNIIAHNYFGIDAEEVWQIIKNNLPALKIELMKLVHNK
ncbi:MAG: DUF86 domain-containing protein [Proteobacteria bacterium]|nr:DUF86 domain-containing protein [Pseudomonadota bacterium]